MPDLTTLSDAELYACLSDSTCSKQERDAAFMEIYRRHSPRVFAYCRRIVGTSAEAQDAFQETFMRFFTSIDPGRTMTNLPAYLLRIARNVCLNCKRQDQSTIPLDDIHSITCIEPYEHDELVELLAHALDLLPVEYREAFLLHDYEGLSYAEIGTIVGATAEVVKMRAYRARQKLRAILAPYLSPNPKEDSHGR